LIVGFTDPHRNFGSETEYAGDRSRPYTPDRVAVPRILPDRPAIREELARYWRSITRLDQGVGLLVDALRESGREDDVLVVFTSDNGAPFPGAKSNLGDAGIRMPLIARNPMQIRRGVVCDAMVSHTDVLPTVLEWMRRTALRPDKARGRSLIRILEQDRPPEWNEVFASQSFHEVTMYYPMRTVRTRTHALILNLASALPFPIAEDVYQSTSWWSIVRHADPRLGDRPLESYLHRPRVELYDVLADPEQRRNLADDPSLAQFRRGLEEKIRDWQDKSGDPWMVKYSHE
jgi:N-sulfoglucosamine sulfohydrolase